MTDTLTAISFSADRIRYLVNRSDSTGGLPREAIAQALGRRARFGVVSDGMLVLDANNRGQPFVCAGAGCARSRATSRNVATELTRTMEPGQRLERRRRPGAARRPMSDPRAIGFFDSGVGGLTVLREVMRRLPNESTIYLGDNARAPYGPRSDDEVRRFSAECLDELAARDVKAIVVACNTSSAIALPELRLRYDVPMLGVVRPGATAAALATRNRRVGVIATRRPSARAPTSRRSRKRIRSSRSSSTRRPNSCRWSRRASSTGALVEEVVARAVAPMLEPGRRTSTRCCSAARTTRCCAGHRAQSSAVDVAVIDSASATASALGRICSRSTALQAPGRARPSHVQLTTGDVGRVLASSPNGCSARHSRIVEAIA